MSHDQPELFAIAPAPAHTRARAGAGNPEPEPDPEPAPEPADPLLPPELFDAPGMVPTAGRKLTKRQRFLIGLGWHPLARALRRNLRLHSDAIADPAVRKGGPRCGGCAYRQLRGGARRDYPKCYLDPLAVTRGQATDVRAWWPGCTEFKEDKCQQPRASRASSSRSPRKSPSRA